MRYNSAYLPHEMVIPTLLVWGVHDIALGKEMATITQRYYRTIILRFVENAGHWVQQECPLAVNQHMSDFLNTPLNELPTKIETAKL